MPSTVRGGAAVRPAATRTPVIGDDTVDMRVDWLSVHAALEELELLDASIARVVELKFFSGMTTAEIADAANVSRATVVRDWRFARAWLADKLGAERAAV